MKQTFALLALAASSLAGVGAVSAQTPPESMKACARQQDANERLRCYDTQMAAMGVAVGTAPPAASGTGPRVAAAPLPPVPPAVVPTPASPPAVVASTVEPPAPSAEERFGLDDLKQAARPKLPKSDKLLVSTITSIKEVRPKMYLIVLANGQIWMQEGTQITSFFKAGFDARIEKGLFGDYRMSTAQTGEQNMVRVSRLQ
jgi:hypothetical protein